MKTDHFLFIHSKFLHNIFNGSWWRPKQCKKETKKPPKNHDDDSGASCQHMAIFSVQGDNVGFKSNSTAKK